jgi:hypothetical protein
MNSDVSDESETTVSTFVTFIVDAVYTQTFVVMLLDSDGNFFNGFISMEGNPNISWK